MDIRKILERSKVVDLHLQDCLLECAQHQSRLYEEKAKQENVFAQ
jgi:hypothetical protein